MASIGKVKIRKVQAIVTEEYNKGVAMYRSDYDTLEAAKARVPKEYFDIHESAWSEIERVLDDAFFALKYRR